MPEFPELPESQIVIGQDGRVISVVQWTLWNRHVARTLLLRRDPDGFVCDRGDPSHGGRYRKGATLGEVMQGMHPDVVSKYEGLFGRHFNEIPTSRLPEFPLYVVVQAQ